MEHEGAKVPLLAGLAGLSPKPQTTQTRLPSRRRFRRCRSAPPADFALLLESKGKTLVPQGISILDQVHPSLRKVAVYLFLYLGIGSTCFYLVRDQITGKKTDGFLDSVYFCIVTMTTVGYGDLVPSSTISKLLASAFVFLGMAVVGLSLSKAADYLVEKQEILLVTALHMREKVGPSDIMKEIETNRVRYKFFMVLGFLLLLIVTGTVFLATVEKLALIDAFYCVCSTITTLGYGDKSFSTKAGRIFAIFWILTGTICLAQFFFCCAELHTESRQRELVNWVLTRRMTKVDLEAADLDDDGVVGAAEFIIYKLKEMGKVNEEDISLIMSEFEILDVDQSGTLCSADITLAQSSDTDR